MGEHLSRARVLMSRGQYPSDEMMENIYLTVDQLDQEINSRYGNIYGFITCPNPKSPPDPVDGWPTPTAKPRALLAAPRSKPRQKGKDGRRPPAPMSSSFQRQLRARPPTPPPSSSRGKQHRTLYSENDDEEEEDDAIPQTYLTEDDTEHEEKGSDSDGSLNSSEGNS